MKPSIPRQRSIHRRSASTVLEMLVAGTLLLGLIAITAPVTVRAGRLWQESRQYRLAVDELSRQIESLTVVPNVDDLDERLKQWSPDADLEQALAGARLTGRVLEDTNGRQLQLFIHWNKPTGAGTVSMIAWLAPSSELAGPNTGNTQ
jgi:hypothetical protein